MEVVEIFDSIEGEGIRSGDIVTLIRLYGCNLKCSNCDKEYTHDGSPRVNIPVTEIVNTIEGHALRRVAGKVTIMGGEPLLQPDTIRLVKILTNLHYEVNVETNGSIDINPQLLDNPKVIITMDLRCPSSKQSDHNLLNNMKLLRSGDVVKFKVSSEIDLEYMQQVLTNYPTKATVYVNPVWGKIELLDIVEYLKENRLVTVRLQAQLHKVMWKY